MKQDPEIDTSKFTVLSVAETFADVIEKVYKFKSISDTFIF
jgi:phosphoribosylpyrophosphate synthetase